VGIANRGQRTANRRQRAGVRTGAGDKGQERGGRGEGERVTGAGTTGNGKQGTGDRG